MAWYRRMSTLTRALVHLVCGLALWSASSTTTHGVHCAGVIYQDYEGTPSLMFGNNSLNWSFDSHPCNNSAPWIGVQCNFRRVQIGTGSVHDDTSSVIMLILSDENKLVGELPPAILNLTNLQYIYIRDQRRLSGPLPPLPPTLQYVVLRNCSFSGSITSRFSSINGWGLQFLDLSNNFFTDFSPYLVFPMLKKLNISNNQMAGDFFFEGLLIQTIDLSNNLVTNINISYALFESFKFIYAQNNSITRFPIELFQFASLQDIYLDHNHIVDISSNITTNVSTIQRISLGHNKLKVFPKELLQLLTLEEIILDFNNISGLLQLPNISFSDSSIKLISLINKNITEFLPSLVSSSRFSESSLRVSEILFLGGNPICQVACKSDLLRHVCRYNRTSPIEDLEFNQKSNKILHIIIACVITMVFLASIITFFVIQRLMKKISLLREITIEFDKRDIKPNLYSFNELKFATQDFHINNELGRGGFGVVYKGILFDGSIVAVKQLTKLNTKQAIQDFLSEIIAISNIKHRNLVQLKGCCIKENQRILVYEFVENKNLANALWEVPSKDTYLVWPTRFNIILEIARGLAYLHEEVQPAIIYRDIKGPNILLDRDFNPKIADFGLALLLPSLDDGETHMSVSKVAGTLGYMSPEHASFGQVSTKLDVFSFGVLVLEIVSGRKNVDDNLPISEQYLVQWAQRLYRSQNLSTLADKSLGKMATTDESTLKQVVQIGLLCLHHIAARRPTMSEVVAMLIGNKNVDHIALEEYNEDLEKNYYIESCVYLLPMSSASLEHVVEGDGKTQLKIESHEKSLQMSEISVFSKI